MKTTAGLRLRARRAQKETSRVGLLGPSGRRPLAARNPTLAVAFVSATRTLNPYPTAAFITIPGHQTETSLTIGYQKEQATTAGLCPFSGGIVSAG